MNGQTANPKYVLRFFFDAGSGICFWSANDAAKLQFDYPVFVEKLPLTAPTKKAVNDLLGLYDESFNWKNPAGAGLWTPTQQKEFNSRVVATLAKAIEELGPDFHVVNEFGTG